MIIRKLFCFAVIFAFLISSANATDKVVEKDCVILLHGLGRTSLSMINIELALKSKYTVVNFSYPSTQKSIEELVVAVEDGIAKCRESTSPKIHFVTHSLGGILVRKYFQDNSVEEASRVVMLGPPNQGSEIVDNYKESWWYKLATGPAGQELGTDKDSLPNQLRPIPLEVGVISGTRSSDPWFSGLFDGESDGKVSVDSTRLEEMKDLLLVERGHTFMANSSKTVEQILYFLEQGEFKRE